MGQSISLDKETFKALAGETRVQILKELGERQKTQSELAAKLHLSAPTVNEHLSLLKKAGLVQEIDDGHKWKYFSLSQKGKNILNPGEKQILLVLSVLTVAFVGFLAMVISQLYGVASFSGNAASDSIAPYAAPALQGGAIATGKAAAENIACNAATKAVSAAAAQQEILQQFLPQIALLVISALFIGLIAGYLLKKRR